MADQMPLRNVSHVYVALLLNYHVDRSHTKVKPPILRLGIRQHSRGFCNIEEAAGAALDDLFKEKS